MPCQPIAISVRFRRALRRATAKLCNSLHINLSLIEFIVPIRHSYSVGLEPGGNLRRHRNQSIVFDSLNSGQYMRIAAKVLVYNYCSPIWLPPAIFVVFNFICAPLDNDDDHVIYFGDCQRNKRLSKTREINPCVEENAVVASASELAVGSRFHCTRWSYVFVSISIN